MNSGKASELDLIRLRDEALLERIKAAISEVENTEAMEQLANLKKLKADGDYYRIRLGDYRIGIVLDGDAVIFVRVLHRKDIYRHFP